MADRDRERVGGVIGARRIAEAQQRRDHPRHLPLVGAPAAAHGALDLLGGVAGARESVLTGRQHGRAAGMPDGERGAHVLAEVELLEGHRVGTVRVHQLAQSRVDVGQPALPREPAPVSITPPSSATSRPSRRATKP